MLVVLKMLSRKLCTKYFPANTSGIASKASTEIKTKLNLEKVSNLAYEVIVCLVRK